MNDLNIAIIQSPIFWEDVDRNISFFEEKINSVEDSVDLIVLPETFTTGFAMKMVASLAEPMDGTTVKWMKLMAVKKNCVVCGSTMIEVDSQYYNRLLWIDHDGKIEHYDKKHLFRLAYEQNYFTPGEKQKTVIINNWKIRLNICYDLRFPVWCRNIENEYDASLFVANWPEPRASHWRNLLQARAIENLSYTIGCNRIGIDGTGKNHTGDSAVISPDGTVLHHSVNEEIIYANLSKELLVKTRQRFQFYKDADQFEIKK